MSTRKKVGRSIEEIIVRRKFDSTNPVTWPDGNPNGKIGSVSQSLPNLNPKEKKANAETATERRHVQIIDETPKNPPPRVPGTANFDYLSDYSDVDKMKMMESLIRYTKVLQNRVEVTLTF